MGRDPKPERKKIPMKTRLIIIAITFVIVNLIFYVAFDGSDDSPEEEKIDQENEITSDEHNEEPYSLFNPPPP